MLKIAREKIYERGNCTCSLTRTANFDLNSQLDCCHSLYCAHIRYQLDHLDRTQGFGSAFYAASQYRHVWTSSRRSTAASPTTRRVCRCRFEAGWARSQRRWPRVPCPPTWFHQFCWLPASVLPCSQLCNTRLFKKIFGPPLALLQKHWLNRGRCYLQVVTALSNWPFSVSLYKLPLPLPWPFP